ncbi:MAG TPA: dockerin type I domain-containing protein, partial [Phycisphaerae bacterium]|nr:dockerin type I domain-containing protein [Phycisphaerae bacterium]
FAYDSDRGEIVLYAGRSGTGGASGVRDDVWVLSGDEWTQLAPAMPVAKAYMGFVYDTTRHKFVLNGGTSLNNDNFTTAQTWEAGYPCLLGDMNGDGSVDGLDIERFLAVALSGNPSSDELCSGDMNRDGSVDTGDVDQFSAILTR